SEDRRPRSADAGKAPAGREGRTEAGAQGCEEGDRQERTGAEDRSEEDGSEEDRQEERGEEGDVCQDHAAGGATEPLIRIGSGGNLPSSRRKEATGPDDRSRRLESSSASLAAQSV